MPPKNREPATTPNPLRLQAFLMPGSATTASTVILNLTHAAGEIAVTISVRGKGNRKVAQDLLAYMNKATPGPAMLVGLYANTTGLNLPPVKSGRGTHGPAIKVKGDVFTFCGLLARGH